MARFIASALARTCEEQRAFIEDRQIEHAVR
jgi:hypothetical protein